jgi:hypothetical protein
MTMQLCLQMKWFKHTHLWYHHVHISVCLSVIHLQTKLKPDFKIMYHETIPYNCFNTFRPCGVLVLRGLTRHLSGRSTSTSRLS